MTDQQIEKLMEEMTDFTAEHISKEEEAKKKKSISETIRKFIKMLSSSEFNRKCKAEAKKYGVDKSLIRNIHASKILNSIGEGTSLAICGIGEAFNYLVRLLSYVLQRIMDFAVSALVKLVNFITFRKEVTA